MHFPSLCRSAAEVQTSSSDNLSQFSVDSLTSVESREVFVAAGDIRRVRAGRRPPSAVRRPLPVHAAGG